ncbi:hypothetical protein [Virgibacillus pantothenticus]|uniref:hypothetical protein n=1 Tax=Virgibacillus pantothenticus TaxID=1473 RepID=UPI000987377A|nr:hypothetical protein [Virgibacillus pantothenticus]
MLTKQQLEEIAERASMATEGPWGIADTSDGAWIVDESGDIITGTTERLSDANFIAHAREDVLNLLEHVSKQKTEIEQLRNEMLDTIGYVMGVMEENRQVDKYLDRVIDMLMGALYNDE